MSVTASAYRHEQGRPACHARDIPSERILSLWLPTPNEPAGRTLSAATREGSKVRPAHIQQVRALSENFVRWS
jgi:hypothetical protein